MSDEAKVFTSTFLQLINLSNNASPDTFYSTDSYNKLASLGPTLPEIKAPFPQFDEAATGGAVKITFKSIKPPYKFSTEVEKVPLSNSIYKIKSDLIESLPELKLAAVEPTDLKFMIKGKVIQDSSILSAVPNLTENVSFMVMVSAPKPKEQTPAPAELDDIVSVPDATKAVVSQLTWKKIHDLLKQDLGDQADGVFEKLQKAVI